MAAADRGTLHSDQSTGGESNEGRAQAQPCDNQGLHLIEGLGAALTAESLALLSMRIISTSPSPDLGVLRPLANTDRAGIGGVALPFPTGRAYSLPQRPLRVR